MDGRLFNSVRNIKVELGLWEIWLLTWNSIANEKHLKNQREIQYFNQTKMIEYKLSPENLYQEEH